MSRRLYPLIIIFLFVASCEDKREIEIILTGSILVEGNISSDLTFLKVSSVLGKDYIQASNQEILKFLPDFPICNFFISTTISGNTYAFIVYQEDENSAITYIMKDPQYIYQKSLKVFQIEKTILYKEINWKTHEVDPSNSITIYGSLKVNQL
ncbi:MAG: hypothetical protein HOA15_02700 [Candidatus Marinimicrobia bacterium]|jgi:hypothetical protein|nr:hypothetical protein [Candidatus Neomarinimicrobiota bacterium]MBT3675385.1 hypothetical protein [Candidatus Neomarinimicrobiota bacterium]MBT3762702.1 hypothetical protein [Candidatus Neomarinimicrobiota bacterium]MBT4068974.1 hypothetical protein [Candidatus Neomarinimicrobiota bacterium]MBT4269906.1 hypothetical protein [Candidatus Neomarinimicrobiota bacterium]